VAPVEPGHTDRAGLDWTASPPRERRTRAKRMRNSHRDGEKVPNPTPIENLLAAADEEKIAPVEKTDCSKKNEAATANNNGENQRRK
jgi:hypothetical protein